MTAWPRPGAADRGTGRRQSGKTSCDPVRWWPGHIQVLEHKDHWERKWIPAEGGGGQDPKAYTLVLLTFLLHPDRFDNSENRERAIFRCLEYEGWAWGERSLEGLNQSLAEEEDAWRFCLPLWDRHTEGL